MSRRKRQFLSLAFITCVLLAASLLPGRTGRAAAGAIADATPARAALDKGKDALRRNRMDEALPLLEGALDSFARANDQAGLGAAADAVGDIHQRQGQYEAALKFYRRAADAFRALKDFANLSLVLTKLGETHYLAGDAVAARAAFAQIGGGDPNGLLAAVNAEKKKRDSDDSVAFALLSASLPGFTCGPPGPGDKTNDNTADNANPPNEPTLGHGLRGRSRSVRMDLRVSDESGNPIKGVKAKLESERQPNGFSCECTHYTDVNGVVLMDPIHLTKTLKLTLKADGYEPQQLEVDPSALDRPYRAVMRAKGAAQAASKAGGAGQQGGSAAGLAAGACLDLHRLFVGYAFGELGLGRDDYEKRRFASARVHFQNVLAAADRNSPLGGTQAARLFRAVARTSLGDVAYEEGRFADAVKLYTQAAEGARADNRLELLWAAQRGTGRGLWALAGQAQNQQAAHKLQADALASYRAALETVETLFVGGVRADDARTNFFAATSAVFDEASSLLAELALAQAGAPKSTSPNQALAHAAAPASAPLEGQALAYAAESLRVAEQGRARALLDLLAETRAEITESVPADLLRRRQENLARQQEIAELLTGVSLAGAQQRTTTVQQLEAELDRLTLEYASLENGIRTASPRYSALVRTQPLTLAEMQQRVLDADTVLLEYGLGEPRSYLWVATRAGLTLHRLPARGVIEQQVFDLRQQLIPPGSRRAIAGIDTRGLGEEAQSKSDGRGLVLEGPAAAPQNVAAYASAASALYKSVVAPAAALIAGKRLLVVADGALNYVPFEALVTEGGGPNYGALSYLVKSNEIVYAPSASVVAALRQQQTAADHQAGRGMLVVADPVFNADDPRAKGVASAAQGRQLTRGLTLNSAVADVAGVKAAAPRLVRLPGTRAEAEQIAGLAQTAGGADVWLDLDASEANLRKRELSRYRVLHVATHGLLDAERPQFTGLALSLGPDADADGFLRVDEVFNLKLGSPLVMLSACETGLGKERRGEGVIGLTRAFMYAGAPTVGVSLWAVADKSTAELMPNFYRRLLAGQAGAPAALRAAQLEMIGGGKYAAPFYWAPFVVVGDWKNK